MKKRIYLFCNEGYGSAYLAAFQSHAKKLANFECRVVFSAKGPAENALRRLARLIGHPLTRTINCLGRRNSCVGGLPASRVIDVNSPEFYETVPKGSIGFICGFNQIFRRPTIERFSSFLNFHPALLPYYRGAIPSYWVIKNGERITGFTAHVVTEAIDAGEIVYQETVEVDPGISEAGLDRKVAVLGAAYLIECLDAVVAGNPFRRSQVSAEYAHPVHYTSPNRN